MHAAQQPGGRASQRIGLGWVLRLGSCRAFSDRELRTRTAGEKCRTQGVHTPGRTQPGSHPCFVGLGRTWLFVLCVTNCAVVAGPHPLTVGRAPWPMCPSHWWLLNVLPLCAELNVNEHGRSCCRALHCKTICPKLQGALARLPKS